MRVQYECMHAIGSASPALFRRARYRPGRYRLATPLDAARIQQDDFIGRVVIGPHTHYSARGCSFVADNFTRTVPYTAREGRTHGLPVLHTSACPYCIWKHGMKSIFYRVVMWVSEPILSGSTDGMASIFNRVVMRPVSSTYGAP